MPSVWSLAVDTQHFIGAYPGAVLLAILVDVICIYMFRQRMNIAYDHHQQDEAGMSRLDRLLVALYRWFPVSLLPRRTVTPAEIPIPAVRKSETSQVNGVKQAYDAFLVLDVEGTCVDSDGLRGFNYPNEIIEWPVLLLRWRDKDRSGIARELEVVDEFRSFVKPTWRPQLSQFCTNLTGITQEQVDCAPTFNMLVHSFTGFLAQNGLIDPHTSERLVRFVWCTDGPWDIRDFVVKQCFLSKTQMPAWIAGEVLDVRSTVRQWYEGGGKSARFARNEALTKPPSSLPNRISLSITDQLRLLNLAPFEGRQHSGIDDTRNVARILTELARRGVKLEPNTTINPNKRWPWMGKRGKVREGYY
ncbi:ribonuclease H-like domain-containing protein [Amylocystis lapponica]|nr:ribonuclease H-like domain-containing protein [Amylocystis lapponica]